MRAQGRVKQPIGPANSATDLARRASDLEALLKKHEATLGAGDPAFLQDFQAFLEETRVRAGAAVRRSATPFPTALIGLQNTIAGAELVSIKKEIETVCSLGECNVRIARAQSWRSAQNRGWIESARNRPNNANQTQTYVKQCRDKVRSLALFDH